MSQSEQWVLARTSSGVVPGTTVTFKEQRIGMVDRVQPRPEDGEDAVSARILFDQTSAGRDVSERITRGELIP